MARQLDMKAEEKERAFKLQENLEQITIQVNLFMGTFARAH
jgi:hypothetical protein